jgi:hypothetical protein
MKKNIKTLILIFIFGLALIFGLNITFASQAFNLQSTAPVEIITHNESIQINSSLKVEKLSYFPAGVHIGQQGTGGVAFLNGTIVNATTTNNIDNPITFGDNVRIDGALWRGSTQGPGDRMPLKVMDDLYIDGVLTGGGSVVVEDDLEVSGNIALTSGAAVDGVDISELRVSNIKDLTASASELNIATGGIYFSELLGSATDAQISDNITVSNYLPLVGGTMAGAIAMSGNDISGIGILTGTIVNATTLQQGGVAVDTLYVNVSGDTMTGNLTVSGVSGLTDADIPDTITASNYLPLSGGTVSGNLAVNGNLVADINMLFVDSVNDRVGIGTATPGYKLHVYASGWKARFQGPEGYINIGPANSGWAHIYTDRPAVIFNRPVYSIGNAFSSYSTGNLSLQTGGATKIFIRNSDGNVGIGTTSPGAKLEVAGGITATSDIKAQTNRFLPQVLVHDTTSSTAAGSGFQTLKSFTVPGGTLGTANSIRVTAWVRRTSGTGTGQFQITYGGSQIALMAGSSSLTPVKLEIILQATGATGSQRGFIHHSNSGSSGLGTGTAAVDSTINQTLAFQVDLGTDTNVWVCDYILAEVLK